MSAEATAKLPGNPAYAWVCAAGGFLGQLACVFCLAIYGMNMTVISEDFGVAVASLAIGTSVFGLCYAGLSFFWGGLADRIGIRLVQSIGCWGMGICLLLGGLIAPSVPVLIVLYAIAGVFDSAVGPGVNPKLIATWFHASSRGKGMTVVTLGGTLAGVLMGIIGPMFIGMGGWRLCFEAYGIIMLVLGVLVFLMERNSPASIGTVPFGSPAGTQIEDIKREKTEAEKAADKERTRRVLKMPMTWKYGIVYIFWQFYLMAIQAFLVAGVVYAGFDLVVAGLVSSLNTAAMCVGTIVMPAVSDRMSRKKLLAIMCLLSGLCFIAFYFVLGMNNVILLYGAILVTGFLSATTPLIQTTVSEVFPPDLRGTGPGMVSTIALIGRFFGPIIAGAIIGATGGNTPMAYIFAGACLVIAAILAWIWLPNTSGKYGDPLAEEYERQHAAALAADAEATASE